MSINSIVRKLRESRINNPNSIKSDVGNEIFTAVKSAAIKVMMSPDFGFDEDDVEDYLQVDITYEKSDKEYYVVNVRAELGYSGMDKLADSLNSIVQYYDKDAYFDHVTPGIIEAWISVEEAMKEDIDESEYRSSFTKEIMKDVNDKAPSALHWKDGDTIKNTKTNLKATFKGYKKDALGRHKAVMDHDGEQVEYSLDDLQRDIKDKVLMKE